MKRFFYSLLILRQEKHLWPPQREVELERDIGEVGLVKTTINTIMKFLKPYASLSWTIIYEGEERIKRYKKMHEPQNLGHLAPSLCFTALYAPLLSYGPCSKYIYIYIYIFEASNPNNFNTYSEFVERMVFFHWLDVEGKSKLHLGWFKMLVDVK